MSDRQLRWLRVAAVAFAVVTAYAIFGSYVVAAAVLGFVTWVALLGVTVAWAAEEIKRRRR